MKEYRITLYKFDGVYGFSYEFGDIFGNNNPEWIRFIAKILYGIIGKKATIKL